jgi:hypothetical protein
MLAGRLMEPLFAHPAIIFWCFSSFVLLMHFYGKNLGLIPLYALQIVLIIFMFIILYYAPQPIGLSSLVSITVMYGVLLFVVLCDAMTRGLARYLTDRRGEKWTKEMDYLYLTIGAVGILLSINRVEFVTERLRSVDILAPLILTTAVVIRFVKTRAEIGEWSKQKTTSS